MDKPEKTWNVAPEKIKPMIAVRGPTRIVPQPTFRNNDAWVCLVCAIAAIAALVGAASIVFWSL